MIGMMLGMPMFDHRAVNSIVGCVRSDLVRATLSGSHDDHLAAWARAASSLANSPENDRRIAQFVSNPGTKNRTLLSVAAKLHRDHHNDQVVVTRDRDR